MARGRVHPGSRFWREIALVITAKAAALILIYILFFASPESVSDVGGHFFSAGAGE